MIGDTKSLVEVGVSMVLRDKFSSETGKNFTIIQQYDE